MMLNLHLDQVGQLAQQVKDLPKLDSGSTYALLVLVGGQHLRVHLRLLSHLQLQLSAGLLGEDDQRVEQRDLYLVQTQLPNVGIELECTLLIKAGQIEDGVVIGLLVLLFIIHVIFVACSFYYL